MSAKPTYEELERRVEELEKQAGMAKQAEEAFRKSEEQFRLMSEATSEALLIHREGILLKANDRYFEMFGYEPHELLGKQIMPLLVEPESLEFTERQIRSGTAGPYESVGLRKNGTKFPMEIHAKSMEYEGRTVRIAAITDISGRKRTTETLRESEEYLASILSRIADPICVKDREHRWVLVNDKFCEIAGASREELLGKSDYDFFPKEEADVFWKMDEEVFQTGKENLSEEYLTNTLTGETIFLNTKKSLYENKKGEKYIVATGRDLTDRKRFEDSLKFERSQLLSIFNSIPQIIYIADPKTYEILYVNGTVKEAFKKDPVGGICYEEFQGLKSPCEFCTNDIILKEKPNAHQWEYHNPILNRDYLLIDKIVKWPDGRDVRFEIGIDITERKRAEEALRESEAQKKAILDASVDRIRLVDKNIRIIWANKTTTRELDVAPEDIIGETCHQLLFGRATPCASCPTLKALESGEIEHAVVYQPESRGIKEETYWDDYAVPIKNEAGEVINIIQITRNITERQKAEEEKKRLEAQLRQAQKMESIGTLAGGVAHDFNNILGIILGNTELAMDDVPEWNPARHNLEEVHESCLRGRDLVRQMLAFSRRDEHELYPVKIGPTVKESLKLLRSTIPTTIEIRPGISADSDLVRAEATQINQVLLNLCVNAAHAMRERGGILEIGLESMELGENGVPPPYSELEPGRYARLRVSDTGHGMEPEVAERIFDPYFTTKGVGEGTGMGLAVVHGIVKSHGGAVTVRSTPGKGTTFDVLLPVVYGAPPPKAERMDEVPKGTETILFVDDERGMVKAVKPMLERLGYEVHARTSSIEALEAFRAVPDRFDLVITDQTMPNMTGAELARELMQIRPDIPIILCTGFSELISEENARNMGIRAFVMKPIVKSQIAETVREVLDKGRPLAVQ